MVLRVAPKGLQFGNQEWCHFGDLIRKPGQSLWLGSGLLTAEHAHPVNLWAHWQPGEDEPWLLATLCHATRLAYRRRMWIEEMFGDRKGHGFDLESTHLIHFDRLSRLISTCGSLSPARGRSGTACDDWLTVLTAAT